MTVVGVLVALVFGGGDGGSTPRAVSVDAAERMALARFRTYEASPSEVVVRLPSRGGDGGTVTVRAVVDHRKHRAVGAYEAAEPGRTTRGLLAWDTESIAVAHLPEPPAATTKSPAPSAPTPITPESTGSESARSESAGSESTGPESTGPESTGPESVRPESTGSEPARPKSTESEPAGPESTGSEPAGPESTGSESADPESVTPVRTAAEAGRRARSLGFGQWTRRAHGTAPLDQALRLVLSVAADRPDTAQVLARPGPLWLRDERLGGQEHEVFAGPRPEPRPQGSAGPEHPSATASDRSPLTYWIDREGNLRRVRARLAPGTEATVDFVAARVRYGVPEAPWRKGR